jgi:hypothetical protein
MRFHGRTKHGFGNFYGPVNLPEELRSVWNNICGDMCDGEDSWDRDTVFELAVDRADSETQKLVLALDRQQEQALKLKAFPHQTYGL